MKKIIIISGPTASGKTNASLHLAKCLIMHGVSTSIVNFDSLLFYRELNIGTAKPDSTQRKSVEHHLIDIASIEKPLDASDFIQLATPLIDNLHGQGRTVILTGGSGFYLRALFKGMYPASTTDEIKKRLSSLYKKEGIDPIRKLLKINDPLSHKNIHPNDHYRIIRATEYGLSSERAISHIKKEMDDSSPYNFHENIHPGWDFLHCYLDIPKEEHLEIIKKRTEEMIHKGLIEEVSGLLKKGFSGHERPLQSIGHKQVLEFIKGNLSRSDLMETINLKTKRLAKAQRTFLKKIPRKNIYHGINDRKKVVTDALDFIGLTSNNLKELN